jgi:putative glutamine amidotransferase
VSRPRIGLTLDADAEGRRYLLPRAYAEAVWRAGGVPVPLVHAEDQAAALLDLLDGLVVTGGAFDIPPELYGEARRPACGPARPERTAAELALLRLALHRQLPLLGVCGGMQLLAVALGGTLYQDLPADLGLSGHEQPPPKERPSHEVAVAPGSLLWRLVGDPPLPVNSTHHQAVKSPGADLAVSARAPDGVIEALELPGGFTLGVQWHPEAVLAHEPRHQRIYAGLVAAAAERR